MNKKAFTLIELLAVIVILAIIALIATPIVLGIINDAREDAKMRSIENYSKAAANALLKKQLDGSVVPDGEYEKVDDTRVCLDGDTSKTCLTVEVEGMKPVEYTMEVSNGKITSETVRLKTGDPSYIKTGNGAFVKNEETNNNEEPPSPSITVTAATTETVTTGNVPAGNYVAGDEYIINIGGEDRIFFVLGLNESDSNKVDLIMNQNIGSTVAWTSQSDYNAAGGEDLSNEEACQYVSYCVANTVGPITANTYLASQTSGWEVTPYLPTKAQIEAAGCLVYDSSSCPTWLWDYLDYAPHSTAVKGYWTDTPNNSNYAWAWVVESNLGSEEIPYGSLTTDNSGEAVVNVGDFIGVRPVITISKSLLD